MLRRSYGGVCGTMRWSKLRVELGRLDSATLHLHSKLSTASEHLAVHLLCLRLRLNEIRNCLSLDFDELVEIRWLGDGNC